jgi:glycosyltransferase involved in cell wall biosynthesis
VDATKRFENSVKADFIPCRVLHVVESLHHGAVENWLVRMLRHARARGIDVDWTFYCAIAQSGALEDEVRSLGARVLRSPVPIGQKAAFVRTLRAELRSGRYDALHCHHDLVSALYLLAAMRVPLRCRIVHVHNADEEVPTPSRVKQRLFREPMRRVCLTLADRIVGNSSHTLRTFLAGRPPRRGRDVVHYYGVDPTLFGKAVADRLAFRRELALSEDALILLFAGRLVPEKNPLFTLDVLVELRRLESRAVVVFAGAGSLEQRVLSSARERGVDNAVRMIGWRTDLPAIMGCCDWFILPHPERPMEGFGLSVVEAQLAGLRMLLSRGIPDDPLLASAVFRRLPLGAGPKEWANAAMELVGHAEPGRASALEALRKSPMDMDHAMNALLDLYK